MSASKKRPVSAQQLAANRANAQHSTGPRTPEGKARSSQNARRHGFAAADFAVISVEDVEAVARLKQDLIDFHQPVNSQELFALERVALAQQALVRAARLEAGLFTTGLNLSLDRTTGEPRVPLHQALTRDRKLTPSQDRNYHLAEGFRAMALHSTAWSLFLRYQAQAERNYRRALQEFERLKSLREKLPNEAKSAPQPEQNKTLPPSEPDPNCGAGRPPAASPHLPNPRSRPLHSQMPHPACDITSQNGHTQQGECAADPPIIQFGLKLVH